MKGNIKITVTACIARTVWRFNEAKGESCIFFLSVRTFLAQQILAYVATLARTKSTENEQIFFSSLTGL